MGGQPVSNRISTLYRLPDGREVKIHADVARADLFVSFTLDSGEVVYAERVTPIYEAPEQWYEACP